MPGIRNCTKLKEFVYMSHLSMLLAGPSATVDGGVGVWSREEDWARWSQDARCLCCLPCGIQVCSQKNLSVYQWQNEVQLRCLWQGDRCRDARLWGSPDLTVAQVLRVWVVTSLPGSDLPRSSHTCAAWETREYIYIYIYMKFDNSFISLELPVIL